MVSTLFLSCAPQEDAAPEVSSAQAHRGPVVVEATLSPAHATAGTRLHLHLSAVTQPDAGLATPLAGAFPEGTWGPLNVLDQGDTIDLPQPDGSRRWSRSIALDCFEPGTHTLPELEVSFTDHRASTEISGRIELGPLEVTIVSELTDESEMADIQGWIGLPGGPWWPWILGGGLAIVALAGTAVCWSMRRTEEGPPPTPAEIARAAIHALRGTSLLSQGDFDTFYTTLSDIVRRYIEGRYGLKAPRKTTGEFLIEAERDSRLRDDQKSQLQAFLRTADLVKFAGHEPPASHGTAALAMAQQFIDDTEAAMSELDQDTGEVATC